MYTQTDVVFTPPPAKSALIDNHVCVRAIACMCTFIRCRNYKQKIRLFTINQLH